MHKNKGEVGGWDSRRLGERREEFLVRGDSRRLGGRRKASTFRGQGTNVLCGGVGWGWGWVGWLGTGSGFGRGFGRGLGFGVVKPFSILTTPNVGSVCTRVNEGAQEFKGGFKTS